MSANSAFYLYPRKKNNELVKTKSDREQLKDKGWL